MKNNIGTSLWIVVIILLVIHIIQIGMGYSESQRTHDKITQIHTDYHTKLATKPSIAQALQALKSDSITDPKVIDRMSEEIARNAETCQAEAQSIIKSTDALINTHLKYIDHQYYVITLWAAVITIVFLVFSFYALFKQEKNINDAKKEVDRIEEIANEIKGKAEIIDKKLDESENTIEKLNEIKSEIDKTKNNAEELFKKLEILLPEAEKKLEKIKEHEQKAEEVLNKIKNPDKEQTTQEAKEKLKTEVEILVKETKEAKTEDQYTADDWYMKGYNAQIDENHEAAANYYKKAIELDPKDSSAYYNIACLYSLLNEKDNAFKYMEKSLIHNDNVFTRSDYESDPDFDNIKSDPRFKELLDQYFPDDTDENQNP